MIDADDADEPRRQPIGVDPLLARLVAEHGRPASVPVIVRYADAGAAGDLKFAAVLDRQGDEAKIRDFATGEERWITAGDIFEAAP